MGKLPAPGPKRWSIERKPSERITKPFHLLVVPVEGFVQHTSHTDMAGLANALVAARHGGPIRYAIAFQGRKLDLILRDQHLVSVGDQEVVVEQERGSLTMDEGDTGCEAPSVTIDSQP